MSITPSPGTIIPKIKKYTIENLLREGIRTDGRKLNEIRRIKITPNYIERAEGSALVELGSTMVLVGVKTDIVPPFSDTPEEGVLVVHAEFVPLASSTFEPGPPDENALELARVIDRSLREVKAIPLNELVLEPKKHVWRIFVDIYVLNHDGNLYDASMLATMAALMNTKLPKAVKDEDADTFIIERSERSTSLNINYKVVTVTVAKINQTIIVDPNYEEEQLASARLVIAVDDQQRIVGMQKIGMGYFTYNEIEKSIELALEKSKIYLNELEKSIQQESKEK